MHNCAPTLGYLSALWLLKIYVPLILTLDWLAHLTEFADDILLCFGIGFTDEI